MFSLSYTNMSIKLKYVLYKANKLMMKYSYVITSLPEEAQVYNNTTMSFYSSKPIPLVGRGARHLLLAASDILLESRGLLCWSS